MKKFRIPYIGKKFLNPPYISDIFQKEKNGSYTKDALMYQNILSFSDDKSCFIRTELYNWLFSHNRELIDDYKDLSTRNTPYSARMANRKDRLDRVFSDLLDMKVLVHSGHTQAKKLNMEIETYSIDKSGKLVLAIIRNMSLKNELLNTQKKDPLLRQMKTKELEDNYLRTYNLIKSNFMVNENIPYRNIVFREFLIKLENKRLFFKFVDYMSFAIHSSHFNRINSIIHLITDTLNYILNRAPERNLFMDLFYESADGLSSEGKEIFLYERKLEIEDRFKNNIKGYSREYEKQCFVERADYNKIVLEGECNECKKSSIIKLTHDEYKSLIRDTNGSRIRQGSIQKFDCGYCQSQNSCSLLTF
ncbi:MAG: hypothetical protein WA941_08845 [Nitrososphaeraceae archaeon]